MNHLSVRADEVIRLAKGIARESAQGFVGTEHLLLAIIREGSGLAAQILKAKAITEKKVRVEIDRLTSDRLHDTWVLGGLPGTPNFQDVVSRAVQEAQQMGDWQVCTVHLLLALLAVKDSTACRALKVLGVNAGSVRKSLLRQMAVG
jgi:ATP-dependent Clp protease ATP-binding subunit ClpC